ncbi:glycoside hydrolase family 125 protein [Microbacterium sp. 69-10]|uniref:glycoside hydrolase family 125 protein n=1 Tax=Microbacterium sp. 69-10 TaxID=1895783 RepID=UPI000AA0C909|nr:glycoside hydrolase family 125 protein [Microbacterium sp. 69-10]
MFQLPESLRTELVAGVAAACGERAADIFNRCFTDTLENTIAMQADGTAFMVTGDIPAMWQRDSAAQLAPYLHFLDRVPELAEIVIAVNRRQLGGMLHDPYANAFNAEANGNGHQDDRTDMTPWTWERKYEIDSLCYPLQLAEDIWRITGRTDHLDEQYARAVRAAMGVFRIEQDHEAHSAYRFERFDAPQSDTLVRAGRGSLTVPTGMSWSAFRPSDDACDFGYNVPGNAFAAVVLAGVVRIARDVLDDEVLADEADALRDQIETGIRAHAVVTVAGGEIYAYEVDGLGGALLADDANVPSLLALPYIGWCDAGDPLYQRTRAFVLSDANPTFASGSAAKGIGSPHTPDGHIWPIALALQGLTATDPDEKKRLLEMLVSTDAGTGMMHESFHKDDPATFTREWFSWANAMFCELALDVAGLRSYVRVPEGSVRG